MAMGRPFWAKHRIWLACYMARLLGREGQTNPSVPNPIHTMSPAAGEADCPFSHCCHWSKLCLPLTPRVYPGREYTSLPTDADDSPARSVVVGIMATSEGDRSLRLHRFRVARSGRVLGRSCDALEILGGDYYKAKTPTSHIRAAAATRSPDGRSLSLCFFSREVDFSDPEVSKIAPPVPLQLHMDLAADDGGGISVSRLPGLPPEVGPLMPTCLISAAGDLWAPYLTEVYGPSSLVMQRFEKDAAKWVKGYVVVGDTILLSLWPFNLFYTFNCSTHAWAVVATAKKDCNYAPIRERGVYVEEDDTIYFLCKAVVYAYKLSKDNDRYQMAAPTMVGRVCPFTHEGYGFLSYLGGRVMCAVWISVKLTCNCDAKHVLVTTFRVKGDDCRHFVPKGVKVLHSTCRRLDMAPNKSLESYLEFSFLQEYEEFNHGSATCPEKRRREDARKSSMLLDMEMEAPASSSVVKSSNVLTCCREFLNEMPLLFTMLEESAIRTKKTLYVICQVASHSTVYTINILDGRLTCHDKTLTPHCILETSMCHAEDDMNRLHRPWHFVCDNRFIYAVPSVENKVYSCCLGRGNIDRIGSNWPIGVEFRLVVRVGIKVVAISDTLQVVYHLFEGEWTRHETSGLCDLDKEVSLFGYVVLSSSTFMVSDAKTNFCFLHNIFDDKWSIVKPFLEWKFLPSGWPARACLSERCVFAKGFIYTCSHEGLAAYELVEQGDSYYLGELVYLQLSWLNCWERNRMCLEYVGEDTSSGAIMLCVMKDDYICQPGYPVNERPVRVTTVQVKTEEMPDGKLKPKMIGHVDIGTAFVESDEGAIWIRDCFAAANIQA
uniref:DUF1618 domain-containing protein n=1 Tax=Oryza meridionalis TaxID=40149 RepID=A0A0E0F574_9ORYZ